MSKDLWREEEPPRAGIYNVVYSRENFPEKQYKSVGYWDGHDWQLVHEASEYQRSENYYFSDNGMNVTHYLPSDQLPELP